MGKAARETRDQAVVATARLRHAGLRPTRQRVELAGLLFRDHDRHVTAETLHDEVTQAGLKVSLATVYNTLHQFTEAGLLRQVIVDAARSYFDWLGVRGTWGGAWGQHLGCGHGGRLRGWNRKIA